MASSGDKLTPLQRDLPTAEEIPANKLTAILSRAEKRDLVDLLFIERQGPRIEGPANTR